MTPILPADKVKEPRSIPPGAWGPLRSAAQVALASVERFLAIEAASGIVLLLLACVALFWVNSPWSQSYEDLWHTLLGLRFGDWVFERDLHFWINDGLMTIFFFAVGLEIRREIYQGELRQVRRAMLPLFAALGGMLMPAAIYFALNQGGDSIMGWGVPMATDIAFAVGVMALLGKRISSPLRILLLTLAVIDDIGAIFVIAIFYSSNLSFLGFSWAILALSSIFAMKKLGVRSPWAYVPPALLAWAGTYAGGIHPTISGVVIGLMTPVEAWFPQEKFIEIVERSVDSIKTRAGEKPSSLARQLDSLGRARSEVLSPVDRLLHALHTWVAFAIMPLFALANAGVLLERPNWQGEGGLVFAGVVIGLVCGKPIGILLFSWIAVRLRWASLPTGVHWAGVTVVSLSAGIGFTMAFFIAQLAFPAGLLLETAKLAILCASGAAAAIAFLVGRLMLSPAEAADDGA